MSKLSAVISFTQQTFVWQDPDLRLGDVVVPSRWTLYQEQHYARTLGDGTHDLGDRPLFELMGENCGFGSEACQVGANTWNYTFMYPLISYGADPEANDPTVESRYVPTALELCCT